jgi:hypothetical protein
MEAMKKPCDACPWRLSNQSRHTPGGWYSKKNLRRLWAGLRTGEAPGMTCHPTDKNNPLPPDARPVPDGVKRHECAGSLLLVQRELKLLEADPKNYVKANRARRGLTKEGAVWWAVSRCVMANTPFGGPPMIVVEENTDVARPMPTPKIRTTATATAEGRRRESLIECPVY